MGRLPAGRFSRGDRHRDGIFSTTKHHRAGSPTMIKKKILDPNRVRCIERGFSFIPHRFLTEGFLASLDQRELLLYFFLVLVSDRQGLSFYSYDAICFLLQLSVDDYLLARDGLIEKDLLAFDGT